MTMAEYIDKSATVGILEAMSRSTDCECIKKRLEKAAKRVSVIPAADGVPVVHGRWGPGRFNLETGNYEAQCIRCRNFSKEYGKPYCPNCGAKMDGGDSNEAD